MTVFASRLSIQLALDAILVSYEVLYDGNCVPFEVLGIEVEKLWIVLGQRDVHWGPLLAPNVFTGSNPAIY
jgi:hypothetical protein